MILWPVDHKEIAVFLEKMAWLWWGWGGPRREAHWVLPGCSCGLRVSLLTYGFLGALTHLLGTKLQRLARRRDKEMEANGIFPPDGSGNHNLC